MDDIVLKSEQIKSLLTLAEEQGISTPFSFANVNEIVDSQDSLIEKLRSLGRLHSCIHEILYTPPRK